MEPIELQPKYSTKEVPGKCIKCLTERELQTCLLQLLSSDGEDSELQRRYEALANFLKSPESIKLRDEAEKYLAEGKQVSVIIRLESGKPVYELKIK